MESRKTKSTSDFFKRKKLYDQWSKTLKYTIAVSMQEIDIFKNECVDPDAFSR